MGVINHTNEVKKRISDSMKIYHAQHKAEIEELRRKVAEMESKTQ